MSIYGPSSSEFAAKVESLIDERIKRQDSDDLRTAINELDNFDASAIMRWAGEKYTGHELEGALLAMRATIRGALYDYMRPDAERDARIWAAEYEEREREKVERRVARAVGNKETSA